MVQQKRQVDENLSLENLRKALQCRANMEARKNEGLSYQDSARRNEGLRWLPRKLKPRRLQLPRKLHRSKTAGKRGREFKQNATIVRRP